MAETKTLDADELLHLAIESSNRNDNERSIMLLKQALESDPRHAKAQYMLGAMHAQIGMYDRAIEDMQKAVELDPKLDTAHFQLGLLYITSGNVVSAEEAWSALDRLGENNPLFLFKRGILKLAQDDFQGCIDDLESGIRKNTSNLPLNNDMQKLIEQARASIDKGDSGNNSGQSKDQKDESHVFISAYNQDDS